LLHLTGVISPGYARPGRYYFILKALPHFLEKKQYSRNYVDVIIKNNALYIVFYSITGILAR